MSPENYVYHVRCVYMSHVYHMYARVTETEMQHVEWLYSMIGRAWNPCDNSRDLISKSWFAHWSGWMSVEQAKKLKCKVAESFTIVIPVEIDVPLKLTFEPDEFDDDVQQLDMKLDELLDVEQDEYELALQEFACGEPL